MSEPSSSVDDLKTWRRGRGYTQKAAAGALGVSRRTVESWEQGRPVPEWAWKLMAYIETYGALDQGG